MCDSIETKKCMNCKIDILLNNFEIHSLHCLKNFYFCTKCQQPVNYSKKVEHEKNHFVIQCDSCNSKFEQYCLNDHLQYDCPNRKIRCQICDIDVEASIIDEHEDYCGSRTEKCLECNEFVMLKYKAIHLDSNHTFFKLADEPGPSPSWQNSKRMLFEYIPDLTVKQHKEKMTQKKKCLSNEEAKFKVFSNNNDKDTDVYSVLPSFRQLQLNEEPVKCFKSTLKPVGQDGVEYCFNNSKRTSKSEDSQAKNMSEFHNFYNKNSKVNEKNVEKNTHSSRITTKLKSTAKLNFNKNLYGDFYVKSKEFNKVQNVEIPCEFCSKLVPIQSLVDHQATCGLIYSKNIIRRKSLINSEVVERKKEVKLPCEICEKLIFVSHLETHQYYCKMKNTKSHIKSEAILDKKNDKYETSYNQFSNIENTVENESTINTNTTQYKLLNKSDKGAIPKTVKVSRKNRRAPSPPKS